MEKQREEVLKRRDPDGNEREEAKNERTWPGLGDGRNILKRKNKHHSRLDEPNK